MTDDAPATETNPAETLGRRRIWPWLLSISLPLYLLDQWSKFWIVERFVPPWIEAPLDDHRIVVIEGYFNLVRVHNRGVAFGMFNDQPWAPVIFPVISLIAFVLIFLGLRRNFFYGRTGIVAAALLICGICGNLTDRLIQGHLLDITEGATFWEKFRAGYVVDFLDFTIPVINQPWPSFNVADSCICVAAVLIFISGMRAERAQKAAAESSAKSAVS